MSFAGNDLAPSGHPAWSLIIVQHNNHTRSVTSGNHNTHLPGCKRPLSGDGLHMSRSGEEGKKVDFPEALDLPAVPGTYVLWLQVTGYLSVQVGKPGTITMRGGLYAYVGSAHGPGGLRARLQRHLRPDKPVHWHIDSVTALIPVSAIWFEPSPERLECLWAQTLAALPGVTAPVPGFGSSDCRCRSHFLAVPAESLGRVWEALGWPEARPSAPTGEAALVMSWAKRETGSSGPTSGGFARAAQAVRHTARSARRSGAG